MAHGTENTQRTNYKTYGKESIQMLKKEAPLHSYCSPSQHATHRKRKNFVSELTTEEEVVITDHEQKERNMFDFYS